MLHGILLAALIQTGVDSPNPDTIVVCPPVFRESLRPWIDHRTRQGHGIVLVSNRGEADDIRDEVRQHARKGGVRFVVLIGDSEPDSNNARHRCVPAFRADAKVNVRWGSEPEIATDNWYADFDDDHVPDAAVGRLTADSPAELDLMVSRIIAYETSIDFGRWRQRINFVAGVGGFGTIADSILEATTKKFLTDSIPPDYTTHMTYGSWRSPYCPDPRSFRQKTLDRLNEGCLFWVYIGHGNKRHLDFVRVPGGAAPIMHADDCQELECRRGSPIAVFLSCYAGAYDQPKDCLAEEMLRQDGGPVAVLCGSRITMPYAMSVMSNQMLHDCFRERKPTLGELFLSAKRKMIEPPGDNATRILLDNMARLISPAPQDLEGERFEHLHLFNLLGDPMLRIRLPETFPIIGPNDIVAGQKLRVNLQPDFAGEATIQLVCRRDGQTKPLRQRRKFEANHQFLADMNQVYAQANDQSWETRQVAIKPTTNFAVEFDVPEQAQGTCFVKVYLQGKDRFATGAHEVYVRGMPTESTPLNSDSTTPPTSSNTPPADLPDSGDRP